MNTMFCLVYSLTSYLSILHLNTLPNNSAFERLALLNLTAQSHFFMYREMQAVAC